MIEVFKTVSWGVGWISRLGWDWPGRARRANI